MKEENSRIVLNRDSRETIRINPHINNTRELKYVYSPKINFRLAPVNFIFSFTFSVKVARCVYLKLNFVTIFLTAFISKYILYIQNTRKIRMYEYILIRYKQVDLSRRVDIVSTNVF